MPPRKRRPNLEERDHISISRMSAGDPYGIATASPSRRVPDPRITQRHQSSGSGPLAIFDGASVYRTTVQAIPTGGSGTIVLWDAEQWDSQGYHSTSSDTGRLVVPAGRAGRYLLNAQIAWAANVTGRRKAAVLHNGAQVGAMEHVALNGFFTTHNVISIVAAAAGDYFEVLVTQASGGNLNVIDGFDDSHFQCHFVGAA